MFGTPDASNDPLATSTRRCGGCGQPAVRCFHVTHHYYKGIPSGRTYEHRCEACGVTFETLSSWRIVTEILSALLLVPMGIFMTFAALANISSSWWLALIGLVMGGAGVWIGVSAVKAVLAETRNPRA